jgi:chemotaxis protein histidine kinase CheA
MAGFYFCDRVSTACAGVVEQENSLEFNSKKNLTQRRRSAEFSSDRFSLYKIYNYKNHEIITIVFRTTTPRLCVSAPLREVFCVLFSLENINLQIKTIYVKIILYKLVKERNMSNSIEFAPVYYDSGAAGEFAYKDYQQKVAMTQDITDSIARSAESINSRIVDAQIATTNAIYNNTQEMIGAFNSGFSNVTREIGAMGAKMSMGFAAMNEAVQKSAQAICDRLDTMNDILNNPSLTKTRELYRRAAVNYNKGFYEEAKSDVLEALASNKTDYISWFLLGKIYLFGASEFSNVIDLDAAVDALKNAVKFITPDARKQEDARVMAAEMCFFLGLTQQTRALDSLHAKNEADCKSYLEQAGNSYGQSYDYSPKMLEARYNRARCKALLGDVPGALADLENLVLADRNYCIKVYADKDFSGITEQFATLIKKFKNAALIQVKKDYDSIKPLMQELVSHDLKVKVTIPAACNEDALYFDVLDYAENLKQIIFIIKYPIIRKKLAKYQKCIATGLSHTVGLKTDGTVVAVGDNKNGQCNVSGWRDIVAVVTGNINTVGLEADGTVVAVGDNDKGQCNVSSWRDIGSASEEQILKWKQAKAEQDAREAAERQQAAEAAKKAKAEQEAKEAKEAEEKRRKAEQQKQWQAQGLCKYCGGKLALFSKKCKSCGKEN